MPIPLSTALPTGPATVFSALPTAAIGVDSFRSTPWQRRIARYRGLSEINDRRKLMDRFIDEDCISISTVSVYTDDSAGMVF
ncbi:unnamed protein product [Gongylonema pulchrum]|uniref:Homeobox domain-containing protein n=1 Tax=Gongylonema pulchrum TaxID=637853 RepID=A0A183CZ15_9BILA|nr:unnamed protein product [Gongylonema pulchrum]